MVEQTQKRAETRETKMKEGGAREGRERSAWMGEKDGKRLSVREERETSSRGDLRSGAALSSLNILADLISPALFQR